MADLESKIAATTDTAPVADTFVKGEEQANDSDIFIDPIAEKRLLRKIDLWLMPLLNITWIFAYLDRSNIGNAAIAGLLPDLGMSKQDFANVVLFFYVTYVPFELPGALLVKKIRPSRLLPLFMIGWACTTLGTGFMTTVPQFYVSRLLIGLFEAGMYPALAITLTTFYTPREQARRFAYMYLAVGLSGAFGGLFAYGLLKLDGARGIAGWRWLFIVEGAISLVVCVFLWLGMPDDYNNAKFLNAEDREIMRLRHLKHERYMRLNERFDGREVVKTFRDPKIYVSGLIQFLGDVLSFGVSTFLPTLVKSFGFDSVLTQLLTVPIYFWAVGVFIALSIWSDKAGKRIAFLIPSALVAAIGYALLCGVPMQQSGVLYFSCFLIVPSIYLLLGSNYTLMLNSHAGYYKRATAIGINMTMGNCAGLIIAQIFKDSTSDGRYLIGEATSLGCSLLTIVAAAVLYWMLKRQNDIREKLTPEQRQQMIDDGATGDAHPDFRYIL